MATSKRSEYTAEQVAAHTWYVAHMFARIENYRRETRRWKQQTEYWKTLVRQQTPPR